MPSFSARRVEFAAPEGYRALNPSVAGRSGELILAHRTVNYTIDDAFPDGDDRRFVTPSGAPIHSRNFLLRLDKQLAIQSSTEILPPDDLPGRAWPFARGLEDLRPFFWRDELWCVACVREPSQKGWREQLLARIDDHRPGECRLADWRALDPNGPRPDERNWAPCVADGVLRFIDVRDPTRALDDQGRTIAESVPPIAVDRFRNGSQSIAFEGGWLALVHEAGTGDRREYRHRFIWFDEAYRLRRVSRPFFFNKQGVEFAAGLAWHCDGERLLVSYGAGDRESFMATVEAKEVSRALEDALSLPSGASAAADARLRGREPPPEDTIEAVIEVKSPKPARLGSDRNASAKTGSQRL